MLRPKLGFQTPLVDTQCPRLQYLNSSAKNYETIRYLLNMVKVANQWLPHVYHSQLQIVSMNPRSSGLRSEQMKRVDPVFSVMKFLQSEGVHKIVLSKSRARAAS